ncbi:MAG: hypothetical protein KKA35_08010, partial [Proteobacteria bacterium]|nr:hypothetical protein [Pseudomonadota bacterium]
IEERDEESITKIPLLGDIPVLGWLFKYRSTSRAKKNLLVFLTPYIIDDFSDLSMITHNKLNDYVHKEKQYVEDELIVAFKEGVTAEAIRKILSGQKISEFKIIQSGVYHLKLDKSINYKKAINIFSSIPEVQKVEPVPRIRMSGER